MNRYASAALWLAIAGQTAWLILNGLALHRSPGLDASGVIILAVCVLFAALRRQRHGRWLSLTVRIIMAADFLLAVSDRFGLLGPPGADGVSWGDFARFVDYTRSITTFLPGNFAPTLAVLATMTEVALGLALLLGVRLRLAAAGSALLLGIYATSMLISVPLAEQLHYNVLLLAAAMLTLATVHGSPLTWDSLASRRRPPVALTRAECSRD